LLLCAIVLFGVSAHQAVALCAEDPSQILTDPGFNLYSVEAGELDDWYAKTVNIPDKSLKEALLADLGMSGGEISVFKMLYNLPETLEYSHLDIKDLTGLEYAVNVKKIYLGNNLLDSAEKIKPLKNLYNLEVLDLSRNQLTQVPSYLFDMPSLRSLNLSDNMLTELGKIEGENVLEELYIENNRLTSLPELDKLGNLQTLSLSGNKLKSFPEEISSLKNLTALAIADNNLSEMPDISDFEQLAVINLEGNELNVFPSGIENLKNLVQIDISENNISEIPEGVFTLPELSALFISFNDLTLIPDGFINMENLAVLDISMNKIDKYANAAVIDNLKSKLGENSLLYEMQYQTLSVEIVQDEESLQPVLKFTGIENIDVPEGYLRVDSIEILRKNTDEENEASLITLSCEDNDVFEYADMTADTRDDYEYTVKAYVVGEYLGSIDISFDTESSADTLMMVRVNNEFVFDDSVIAAIIISSIALIFFVAVMINAGIKKRRALK